MLLPVRWRFGFGVLVGLLLVVFAQRGFAAADDAKNPAEGEKPAEKNDITSESVTARRAALQKEIATTRSELGKMPEGKLDETALWLTQETALLERLDNLYVEQQRTLQHAADLAKESEDVEERTKGRRPPEATLKPPFGVELLDQLYGERDYLEQARGWLKTDVSNATEALREARDGLEEKQRARRTARETLEKAKDRAKAQSQLRLAELESRLAQETVALREKALRTLKLQQSLLEPKQALLAPSFDWLRSHLVLSNEEVAAAKARREKREAELDAAIGTANENADQISRLVVSAERRSVANEPDSAELESRRADRQTANLALAVLTRQRERLSEASAIEELRRRVLMSQATGSEMRTWAGENQVALDRLEKDRKLQLAETLKSRKELQDLQARLTRATTGDERNSPWIADRVQHLTDWVTLSENEIGDIDGLRTERNRLKEELGARVSFFSWRDTMVKVRGNVIGAWNYEAFSVQDQPIRVKTILAVIALIFLGHWASRKTSDVIGRTVFHRMGMNTGRRAAWQTLSFYALFLIVLLAAFNLFHLSLTQFSVVSGALAVGIGFGSQNLIGNFISGIILLIERPVNQGDIIEIDGEQVTVERLGPRSTIVRSFDNTHVIVPNSRLLEQTVKNLTLSDDVVRTRIRVGVAYGSKTREVERVLREVLLGLEGVHRTPGPKVKFEDFADSALVFDALFWSGISERREVEGELRHRIGEAFEKHGIVMAFPQRDIHLDTVKPLQVQITSTQEGERKSTPPNG
ncbi:MAG: mechanosensitive ion channel domain-containing protein [Opitutus sp.]